MTKRPNKVIRQVSRHDGNFSEDFLNKRRNEGEKKERKAFKRIGEGVESYFGVIAARQFWELPKTVLK
ncbi:Uncharacterized protein APZ42_011492 [Daphnia magna]|uniref:Uncharacterized protein n=1 Tax=Daphnia magna TaxID=35525 RepID=A0A0N8DRE2_9CRUS|nr:Uncharacterized protein APZ42_011492 [Daphnia magna]